MASDDELHPGHHSMRLKHRDYSLPGLYFVTICTHEKACILGRIVDRSMYPSPLGNIVAEIWNALPAHFAHVKLPAKPCARADRNWLPGWHAIVGRHWARSGVRRNAQAASGCRRFAGSHYSII